MLILKGERYLYEALKGHKLHMIIRKSVSLAEPAYCEANLLLERPTGARDPLKVMSLRLSNVSPAP